VELLPAPGGSNVESVLVVDQKGQTHRVAAKRFVVAVGGLETARLFLNSTRFGGHGPGNRRGFVGSQFIDHATLRIGMFHPMRGAASAGVLGNTVKGPHGVQTRLTLAPSRQRDLGIGNHALELMADHASKKGMMQSPSHNVHLIVEQTPSTLCNVTVDPEKDLNCARLARVNWALSPEDMEGAKKFVAEMKRNLDPQYGTFEVDESVWGSDDWRVCGHQMGTTRMALAAGEGVIDVNCRVFGTNNLFVAGGAGPTERFLVGGSKTVRQGEHDVATVVAAGITLHEALKAYAVLAKDGITIRVIDAYSVQPIDRDALVAAGKATRGRLFTVEDHYAAGGLGDAVAEAVWDQGFSVRRLAVREIPRSGPPDVLLDTYGISARAIVDAVRAART
jgi:choline dehydrogenase-like flavoprotein